jgi:hypothetical protein
MWRTCGPMANRAACCAALLMAMGDTGAGAKTTRARSSSAGVLWPLDPCCSQRVIVGEQSFWTGSHFIAQETWRPFLTTHGAWQAAAGRSQVYLGRTVGAAAQRETGGRWTVSSIGAREGRLGEAALASRAAVMVSHHVTSRWSRVLELGGAAGH